MKSFNSPFLNRKSLFWYYKGDLQGKPCAEHPGATAANTGCVPSNNTSGGGNMESKLSERDVQAARQAGVSEKQYAFLKQQIKPAEPDDLTKPSINLWHGTYLDNVDDIIEDGLDEGERGLNAAANVTSASQYPEDTGAESLMLIQAATDDLDVDPVDQIGDTVEEGLFPSGGMGSSCTVGRHKILASFDIENAEEPDDAIRALNEGDLAKAIESGAKILFLHSDSEK